MSSQNGYRVRADEGLYVDHNFECDDSVPGFAVFLDQEEAFRIALEMDVSGYQNVCIEHVVCEVTNSETVGQKKDTKGS